MERTNKKIVLKTGEVKVIREEFPQSYVCLFSRVKAPLIPPTPKAITTTYGATQ